MVRGTTSTTRSLLSCQLCFFLLDEHTRYTTLRFLCINQQRPQFFRKGGRFRFT